MKTALITGASGGIGGAIAKRLNADGFFVLLHAYQNHSAVIDLKNKLNESGVNAWEYVCDISNYAQVERMFSEINLLYGGVDVLVNNAGISQIKPFTDITYNDWTELIDVNLTGMFNTCHFAVPEMIKRKKGRIINVSSMWGITGASCETHYSASKAGVIGFTKALAAELAPSGITVNCVAPGMIETKMNSELTEDETKEFTDTIPMERQGTPDDVANAVSFLAQDGSNYITGQVISPNGGLVR